LNIRRALTIAGCLLVGDPALAGPPFVTDDPELPPSGAWEINVPFILERTPGRTDLDAPLFDLNYGLPELQLKAEFPIEVASKDHGRIAAGVGDLLFGVKWRFLHDESSQLQLGFYPQLRVPTGNHARDLGQGQPAFVLPFLAQKSWDNWTLYGNLGYWRQTAAETRNYVYAGAVLEREINEQLTLGAELFGNFPKEQGGSPDVGFNVGGAWKVSGHLSLLFSGGGDIVGDTNAMAYIGLQLLTK
jgi:Putative MetA-pathway of phenol degradation